MKLKTFLKKSAQKAISGLGDVAKKIKFHQTIGGAYQSASGAIGASTRSMNVSGIVSRFALTEIDNIDIKKQDLRLLVPANAFGSATPTTADQFEIDNQLYTIVSVKTDPAEATYTFQLRLS